MTCTALWRLSVPTEGRMFYFATRVKLLINCVPQWLFLPLCVSQFISGRQLLSVSPRLVS